MAWNIFKKKISYTADDTKNPKFCIMPWVHFHVAQNGNVIPCCQAPPHKVHSFGNINEKAIEEIWDSEAIQEFRRNMLSGKGDSRCKQCYIKEEQGWNSLRKISNEKFKTEIEQVPELGLKANKPVYFDLRFSNACNLKCRICGPWASSQWYKDAVAMGMRDSKDKALTLAIKNEDQFFEELLPLLKEAKEFYFAGGEPLMMEQHYRILQALIDCGNTEIQLSYNTNFSTFQYKDYQVLDFWKQFPHINIAASLDAEGKKAELLRKNLNWEKVIANRKTILAELPHIEFMVSPTVCIFNVEHLPDFHKNWVNQNLIFAEDFIPNVLINPKAYHLAVMPLEDQKKLKEKYRQHLDWYQIQKVNKTEKFEYTYKQFLSIKNQLGNSESPELIEELRMQTQKLDQLRMENSSQIFPELNSVLGNA